jgi:hypothetical protein
VQSCSFRGPHVIAKLDPQPNSIPEPVVGTATVIKQDAGSPAHKQRYSTADERVQFPIGARNEVKAGTKGKKCRTATVYFPHGDQRATFTTNGESLADAAFDSTASVHVVAFPVRIDRLAGNGGSANEGISVKALRGSNGRNNQSENNRSETACVLQQILQTLSNHTEANSSVFQENQ